MKHSITGTSPPQRRRLLFRVTLASLVVAVAAVGWGCSASDESGASSGVENSGNDNGGWANNGANNGAANNGNPVTGNNANNNSTNNGFIPEPEETFNFRAPRSTRNFVFVANTSLDAVAKVDARTLEISSIEVGDRPTVVRTYKPANMAVVLSEGSSEVSVIRAGDATDYVVHMDLPRGMNAMEVSPKGDWALAWFDFNAALADPETEIGDAPPFQELALVKLEEGEEVVYRATVGFQVLSVAFDDAGDHAYVVTRSGVSVVKFAELTGDTLLPPVSIADVGIEDELEREVAVTGDGRYAFVRSGGLEGINIVDLDSREIALVALDAIPTDLDIVPGENRAMAVVRQTNQLAIIDLPGAISDPDSVRVIELGDEPAGQAELTADARKAVVFTAAEERQAITVVNLADGEFHTWPLRKGVKAVAVAPWGDEAVIFHSKQPGEPRPGESQDQLIAKSWGYSLFDIETGFAKLETVPSEPGEFLFTEEGGRQKLYILLNDKARGVRQVEIINMRALSAQSLRLGSPPEHIGIIPNDGDPRIYISQEHGVGRMSFIFEQTGEVRTVTGFQLNSLIE